MSNNKLAAYEPGQIVRGIDLSAFRVTSKVAGPDGAVVKLATLRGEPVSLPANFIPVDSRMAHLASALFFHLAFKRDFDLYVRAYCERAKLPIPIGPDGKPFRWAEWLQSTLAPKLFTPQKDFQDAEAIKDEAIHEMLFNELGHRNILGKFDQAIKNFHKSIRKLPLAQQLTVYLTKNFRGRVEEMNRKIKGIGPSEEVSMFQPGDESEGETEVSLLDTEQYAQSPETETIDTQHDISQFRSGFYEWLKERQSEKAAKWFVTLFDIYWQWVSESSENVDEEGRPAYMPARRHLEPEWSERTNLSNASLYDYIGRLAKLLEQYIHSSRESLGADNVFVRLLDDIQHRREQLKKKRKPRQKAMPAHAALAALNTAAYEDQAMTVEQLHQRMSSQKTASTNSACLIIEWEPGQWYYVLEQYKDDEEDERFDWLDYADAFGPFKSEEEAQEHLSNNHANPGGYSTEPYRRDRSRTGTLAKLIAEAPKNVQRYSRSRWGSTKQAKLVRGDELTPEMLQQIKDAFIYRWTVDNPHRTSVYHCDKCDIHNPYDNPSSAEGHSHPTISLQTDSEWVREHSFYFTNDNRLREGRSAEPIFMAGEPQPQYELPLAPSKTAGDANQKKEELREDLKKGGPGLDAYAYAAALYCPDCGEAIIDELIDGNVLPIHSDDDPASELTGWMYDTDTVPQPVFFGESDTAEYCDNCQEYLYGPQAEEEPATDPYGMTDADKDWLSSMDIQAAAKDVFECCGGFKPKHKTDCPVYNKNFDDTMNFLTSLPKRAEAGSEDDMTPAIIQLLNDAADKLQDYCNEVTPLVNDPLAMKIYEAVALASKGTAGLKDAAEPQVPLRPDITPGDTGRLPHAKKEGAGPLTPQQMQTQTVQQSQIVQPPQNVQPQGNPVMPVKPVMPPSQGNPNDPLPGTDAENAENAGDPADDNLKRTIPPELPNAEMRVWKGGSASAASDCSRWETPCAGCGACLGPEEGSVCTECNATVCSEQCRGKHMNTHQQKLSALKTEQNTPEMEQEVEQLIATHPATEIHQGVLPVFEHEQWWATCGPCGAIWSVVDAEGGQSSNGLDLEEIEYGDESCLEYNGEHVEARTAASSEAIFADKKRFFESVQRKHRMN